jgi:hypothetical protein
VPRLAKPALKKNRRVGCSPGYPPVGDCFFTNKYEIIGASQKTITARKARTLRLPHAFRVRDDKKGLTLHANTVNIDT